MELLTDELVNVFKRFPIRSQEKEKDPLVLCKFFHPCGRYTLYVTEAGKEEGDWILFGYCISPLGPDCDEWGYSSLNELQEVRGPLGLGVERDIFFPLAEKRISQFVKDQ